MSGTLLGVALLALPLLASAGAAQQPVPGPGAAGETAAPAAPRFDDPYRAYDEGAWDQALAGFLDLQVERPEDPEVALNVGSAHYRMRNWAEAERSFSRALLSARPEVRERALYNLGNTAYRQGRLGEAVELYRAALEIDPDDEDAKFNLEFVRDEIRRRHEEAKKRQQQQEQQEQQGEQGQQDGQQEESGEQQRGAEGAQPPPDGGGSPPDRDGDGLPDETERSAENPTDPDNPDSDGDGLVDGAEDANRNGRVDPGETDPNRADSDGDGVPDGQDPAPAGEAAGAAEGAPEPEESLTPEEALRYLQALEEARPGQERAVSGRSRRPTKDW